MRITLIWSTIRPAVFVAGGYAVIRELVIELLLSKPSDWVWDHTWIVGDFVEWRWSTLIIVSVILGGIYAASAVLDKGRRIELKAGESAIKVSETAVVKVVEATGSGQSTMERRKQPDSGTDGTYIDEGIWREAKWRAFRLPNGRVDAEGPLCIDDDTALVYCTTLRPHGIPVKDYHEVAPPESYLYCPSCKSESYLDATEKKAQRVGDARRYAAWRIDGGRTPFEKIIDRFSP